MQSDRIFGELLGKAVTLAKAGRRALDHNLLSKNPVVEDQLREAVEEFERAAAEAGIETKPAI